MDLSGIRILDLTRLLPGPYATQLLADLGADVIKVEDPNLGDYARDLPPFTEEGIGTLFDAVNRGKRSVSIDLKSDDGQQVFMELVADADVVFEGFRPGVAERLGVDYERIREENSDIVYCSLSGFGQTGPLSDTVGHDLNYEGYAGLLYLTRADETADPQMAGFPMADMAGGTIAAFSILGALLSRELGGGGDYLDISMTEALASFGQPLVDQATSEDPPRPGETEFTGGVPWYDIYETADGQYVTFAPLEPEFFENFCAAVGREDLVSSHGTEDPAEQAALRQELESLFESRTRDEWLAEMEDVEATVGPVLPFDEALSHPQFEARDLVDHGGEGAARIRFPGLVDGNRPAASGIPPRHGEDTVEVLTEVGLDHGRVEELLEAGVLKSVAE